MTASNTAPSSTDASGNPVTYVPANVIDGDVQTAWRTPGDGHDEWVTLIFDNPIDVVRIGLIPGYAKTDPQTGANRFLQDRIITVGRATRSPGSRTMTQTFQPLPVPQFVELRATTSRITVKILGTTGGRRARLHGDLRDLRVRLPAVMPTRSRVGPSPAPSREAPAGWTSGGSPS